MPFLIVSGVSKSFQRVQTADLFVLPVTFSVFRYTLKRAIFLNMNFSYNISSLRYFLCISGLFFCILRVRLFLCRAGLLGRDDGLNTVDGRAERVEFFLIAGHNADRAVRVQIVGDVPQL